ncbi:hypothetical protein ACI78R_18325 [Geodermatophilus sp. SYSU D01106]
MASGRGRVTALSRISAQRDVASATRETDAGLGGVRAAAAELVGTSRELQEAVAAFTAG